MRQYILCPFFVAILYTLWEEKSPPAAAADRTSDASDVRAFVLTSMRSKGIDGRSYVAPINQFDTGVYFFPNTSITRLHEANSILSMRTCSIREGS